MVPVVQHAQVDSIHAEVCPGCLPRCHTIDLRAGTDDICYVLIECQRRVERHAQQFYCLCEAHDSARHTDTSRRLYAIQPLMLAKDDYLCLSASFAYVNVNVNVNSRFV